MMMIVLLVGFFFNPMMIRIIFIILILYIYTICIYFLDTHGYSCAISIGKFVFIIIKGLYKMIFIFTYIFLLMIYYFIDPSIPSISITYPNSGLMNGRCIPKFNDSNIGHIVY